ncbi:MAG TPA: hypothetical protein VED40_20825 [Azospirillaceae bacterium]|nr:hypothetical protein [Azospirillaceae bacterium]
MQHFDSFIGIDWSGAHPARGVAVAVADADGVVHPVFPRERWWRREEAVDWLLGRLRAGERFLAGIDCAFALPWVPGVGYLDGRVPHVEDLFGLWELVEEAASGDPDLSAGSAVTDPRFEPSFWVRGTRPAHWGDGSTKRRRTELAAASLGVGNPVSVLNLAAGPKQVGKASLAGMRALRRLKAAAGESVAVWPAEDPTGRAMVTEIFPTLFRKRALSGIRKITGRAALEEAVAALGCTLSPEVPETFDDHLGDALVSAAGLRCVAALPGSWAPAAMDPAMARREGWIFGVGA